MYKLSFNQRAILHRMGDPKWSQPKTNHPTTKDIGKVCISKYWGERYTILKVVCDGTLEGQQTTIQWSNGRIVKHCTPWIDDVIIHQWAATTPPQDTA